MTKRYTGLMAVFISLLMQDLSTFAKDIAHSKDHPLISRYEGSRIHQYSFKKFDAYQLALGPAVMKNEYSFSKTNAIEGAVTRIMYIAPKGRSALEVMRNYEQALSKAKFEVLYQCNDKACGPRDGFGAAGYKGKLVPFRSNEQGQAYFAAKLSRPTGDVYVALYVIENTFWGADVGWGKEKNHVVAQLDVIETKPMESGMVVVDAESMAKDIGTTGHVALYGIFFDTDQAVVKPESTPTLKEIAKLLKNQPSLKLVVVGHTDNVGTFEHNIELSKRRAQAVVQVLVNQHGIQKNRLRPYGVGFLAPMATNRTEGGRAQNRRVVLVEP